MLPHKCLQVVDGRNLQTFSHKYLIMSSEEERSLSSADTKRYKELFDKLDVNKDGIIELSELSKALKATKTYGAESDIAGHAKQIISKADQDASSTLDINEFVDYMQDHEEKLKMAFTALDRNRDGRIEPKEIQMVLKGMGLGIDEAEAERLTKRVDKDGSLSITWEEWRDFFCFSLNENLEDIIKFWRTSLMIDIGDNMTVPPEFTEKEKKTGMWWRHLVAGGTAGAVSRTCTAPLDRLKILLQVHGARLNLGILSGFQHMIKEGGVRGLWRGNGTNVLKIAPESAIKFAAYEQIKKLIQSDSKEISLVERFAAGSSAGAFSQSCIYPMEVLKTRLAVAQTGQYKGMMDCIMKTVKQNGIRGLYKGFLPNMMGIIPYAGIDLSIYETLKQFYLRANPDKSNPGVLVLMTCGTLSSTCGQLASYPLALVRTKMQAQVSSEAQVGFVPLFRTVVREEGFRGLYRGIFPNFLKVLPAVSISYVVYEQAKGRLGVS